MSRDDDSSGEFEASLKKIGGEKALAEAKKAEEEAKPLANSEHARRHRHSAGKRVVVHQGEVYHETTRDRVYRKRAEQQRRYQAVKNEESVRRERRRQRRVERREQRRHGGGGGGHGHGGAAAAAPVAPEPKQADPDEKSSSSSTDDKKKSSKASKTKDAKDAKAATKPAAAATSATAATAATTTTTTSTPTTTGAGETKVRSVGVKSDQNAKFKTSQEDDSLIVADFDKRGALYVVLDGHSGRDAVDVVLRELAPTLRKCADAVDADAKNAWEAAFTNAFAEIDEHLKLPGNPGTTIVAALLRNGVVHCANAGDARAVVCQDGKAIRLSYDHKANDPEEVKRCEAMGGSFLWGRLQGQTMITRALGDHDIKKFGCVSKPHYSKHTIDKKTQFLILACDGIWDVMTDDVAVAAVRDLAQAGKADDAAALLISESLRLGSKDNVTAMVICF